MDEQKTVLTQDQYEDFKMFSSFALSGILGQIPFGVTVDPAHISNIVKNIALAMLEAQKDIEKE